MVKKLSYLAIGLVLSVTLIGCAGQDSNYSAYLNSHQTVSNNNNGNVIAYFGKTAETNKAVMEKLAGNETSLILYAMMSNQQDLKVLETMRTQAPVAPRTQNDVLNTIAGTTVPTFIRWGFGSLLGSKLVDGLAGAQGVHNSINTNDQGYVQLDQSKNITTSVSTTKAGGDLLSEGDSEFVPGVTELPVEAVPVETVVE